MADFPAIPLVLESKKLSHGHIVLGHVGAQVDFLREILGGSSVEVTSPTKVDDIQLLDRLQNPKSFIYVLPNTRALVLAEDIRRKVNIWVAAPVRKRTAAIRALIRMAVGIIGGPEVPQDRQDRLGDRVVEQLGEDAPLAAMIYAACWMLTETEEPVAEKLWINPWDKAWTWRSPKTPMSLRLNVLYRNLVAWVYARDDNRAGAESVGVKPAAFQWLKTVRMDPTRVDAALVVLSAWRTRQDQGYTTALKIGAIFER